MKKKFWRNKKKIPLFSAVAGLTLLCAACVLLFASYGAMLAPQREAERFRGESDTRFAQVSAFFKAGEGKTLSDIYTFRKSVESALTDASLKAEEGKSLWADAYSAEATITVKGPKGSAEVQTLGVGGDWFMFHPLRLRSGAYISEDDLMHDKVVLDEELAWKLFGGVDLAGMEVTINGAPYIVAGVVEREDDFASLKAYGGGGMFMYYDAMNTLAEVPVSAYELVCADPISGFALGVLQTGFPKAETVENSGRFGFGSILSVARSFAQRSMSAEGIAYPYWENAARMMENDLALVLVLAFAFGLFPGICAVWAAVLLFRRVKSRLSETVPARWEKITDRVREHQRLRLVEKAKRQ